MPGESFRAAIEAMQDTAVELMGVSYDYEPHDSAAVVGLAGIFRGEHVGLDVGSEAGEEVSTRAPHLDVKLRDLPRAPAFGTREETDVDTVTIHFGTGSHYGAGYVGDLRFRIWDAQPDGEGMVTLILHQAESTGFGFGQFGVGPFGV